MGGADDRGFSMKGLDFLWLKRPSVDPGFGFSWDGQEPGALRSWAREQLVSGIKAIALSRKDDEKIPVARKVLEEVGLETYLFAEGQDDHGRSQINVTSFCGRESWTFGVLGRSSLKMPPNPRWNTWFVSVKSCPTDEESIFGRLLYWSFRHRVELSKNNIWRVHPHEMTAVEDAILLKNVVETTAQKTKIPITLSVVMPIRLSRASTEDVLTVVENVMAKISQYAGELLVVVNEEVDSAWTRDRVGEVFEGVSDKYPGQMRLVFAEARSGVFCAGAARNLGASLARGPVLAFVDGDTLPNGEWFEDVLSRHQHQGSFSVGIRRNHPKVRHEMEAYWVDFNRSAQIRLAAPNGWKYVCSHTLAMNQSDWVRYGGFAWSFQSYGYEDTELGYRLSTAGLRRELARGESLHFDARDAEESPAARRRALAKAGSVFFGSYPCMEIAHHAYYLFQFSWMDRIGERFRSVRWRLKSFFPSGHADHTHTR